MKKALLIALAAASTIAFADNYVRPYVKSDGTFVEGHFKSAPDRNPYNNYSTQGNSNPYTGQQGSRDPYQVQQQYQQPSYNSGSYGNPYGGGQGRQRDRW